MFGTFLAWHLRVGILLSGVSGLYCGELSSDAIKGSLDELLTPDISLSSCGAVMLKLSFSVLQFSARSTKIAESPRCATFRCKGRGFESSGNLVDLKLAARLRFLDVPIV